MKNTPDNELMKELHVDRKTLEMFKKVQKQTLKEAKKLGKKRKGKIKILGISGSARYIYDMAQENSNSEELLKRCLAQCEKLGAKTEMIILRDESIGYCKACYSTTNTQCHFYCSCYPKGKPQGDDMTNKLYDKILEADAIIFATPVNNFKMSTLMATFLDRCISLDGSLPPADPKDPKNRELNIKHMKFIERTTDPKIPGSGMLRRFPGKVAGLIVTGHEEGASMVMSSLFMTLNHFGMMFPPFSTVYAMSSECISTYEDKERVLGECHKTEIEMLAKNMILGVKAARAAKPTEWGNDNSRN
ncbi:MAG: flavodoxin family protein [archaeon]